MEESTFKTLDEYTVQRSYDGVKISVTTKLVAQVKPDGSFFNFQTVVTSNNNSNKFLHESNTCFDTVTVSPSQNTVVMNICKNTNL